MTKNEYFGPILAVIGPKILIFMGVSKSFGTNRTTENHLGNLSTLFFGQALDQMGQKCRYLAENASFGQIWPFWGQKPTIWRQGVKLLVTSYWESNETPFFVLNTLTAEAPILR